MQFTSQKPKNIKIIKMKRTNNREKNTQGLKQIPRYYIKNCLFGEKNF